jgi:inward rectifier potassium channel
MAFNVNEFIKRIKEYTDSGFGADASHQPERLINQNGALNTGKTGLSFFEHFSISHFLITINRTSFNFLVVLSYLLINLFFGGIYYFIGVQHLQILQTNSIEDFWNAFYISAQTFSTVGFGSYHPDNNLTNFVAVPEMLAGMMHLALAAGLLFARFSRPVSKIIYSNKLLVAPYKSGYGLMFRLANAKNNLLLNVTIRVFLTMKLEIQGLIVRKFFQLPLEMNHIDFLALSWTVVHPLDEKSPLYGMKPRDLKASDA